MTCWQQGRVAVTLPSENDTKLWLALLYEINQAGGAAEPAGLYPRLQQYFPEITEDDLSQVRKNGESVWTNRIRWARHLLCERGCIDGNQRGIWRLAPPGKKWLDHYWRGPTANYADVPKPPRINPPPPPPLIDITTQLIQQLHEKRASAEEITPSVLIQHLQQTQRASSTPQQFESALADAFRFLGVAVEQIGGAGDTDIVIRAPLGEHSYSAVVDAKTAHNGRVTDALIRWDTIDRHRTTHGSTFAAVIGEDFSEGQLRDSAHSHNVTLISTQTLAELLRLHDRTPLSLLDLKALFAAPGLDHNGLSATQERSQQYEHHWQLLKDTIDLLDAMQQHGYFNGTPEIREAHAYYLGHGGDPATTRAEFTDVIVFLANPSVGILKRVAEDTDSYQLTMSPLTARRRLTALVRFLCAPAEATPAGG
jgi:hypothetical protein